MKTPLRRMTAVILLGITITGLTGCTQEDMIDGSSKFIADIITSSLEAEREQVGISEEQIVGEDEPEVIKQHIKDSDYQQNEVYQYYYEQLNTIQREVYNQLYETVEAMSESTTLNLSDDMTQEDISVIFRALRYDHPEVYWIQGYKYIQDGSILYFYPNYLINTEEKTLYDNQLEAWTEKALESVDSNMTGYEKEIALYDFLVANTEYSLDSDMNQSLISVVRGETVCLGYTKAMKYLCDRIGLDCIVVEGISKEGVAHSWNKIKVNGDWYNVDVTNSSTAQIFSDSYDMFNITDDLINLRYTETILGSTGEERTGGESTGGESSIAFEYPVANSIEADYYNMKGLYIESLEEIGDVVNNHIEDGTVTIRLGDQCDMKEELQEYMKHIGFKDSEGRIINIKCVNYITINYIRLLEINWS